MLETIAIIGLVKFALDGGFGPKKKPQETCDACRRERADPAPMRTGSASTRAEGYEAFRIKAADQRSEIEQVNLLRNARNR